MKLSTVIKTLLWITTLSALSSGSPYWCVTSSSTTLAFVSGSRFSSLIVGDYQSCQTKITTSRSKNYFPVLQYATDGNRNKIVKGDNNNDVDPLLPVYQTVAEQDPLWYDKFVINVLGENLAKEIGLPESIPVPLKTQEEQQQQQQHEEQEPKIILPPLETIEPRPPKYENTTPETSTDPVPLVMVEQTESVRTICSIALVEGLADTAQQNFDEEKQLLVSCENVTVPQKMPQTESNSTTSYLGTTGEDDEPTVVLYRDPDTRLSKSVPISNLTQLGYSQEEILRLQSDVVALIVSEQLNKSRTGIPSQLQNPSLSKSKDPFSWSSVRIVSSLQADKMLAEENERFEKTASDPTPPLTVSNDDDKNLLDASNPKIEKGKVMPVTATQMDLPSTDATFVTKTTEKQQNYTIEPKAIASNQRNEASAICDANEQPISPPKAPTVLNAKSVLPDTIVDDNLVVFMDSFSGRPLQVVALSDLTSLGYTKDEIVLLLPDVLDLIFAEKMAKPRSGVPPHWQQRASKDGTIPTNIQMLTRAEFQMLQREDTIKTKRVIVPDEDTEKPAEASSILKDNQSFVKFADKSRDSKSVGKEDKKDVASLVGRGLNETELLGNSSAPIPGRTFAQVDSRDFLPKSTQATSAMEGARESIKERADQVSPKESQLEEELVVEFFDATKGKQQLVPLGKFTTLGFTKDEVLDLQPEVLATIFAESTQKPRTGIPSKWRKSKQNGGNVVSSVVQVLPKLDAEEFVMTESKKAARNRDVEGFNTVDQRTRRDSRAAVKPGQIGVQAERSREKRAFNPDGSKKNIYSVRSGTATNSSNQRRKGDPPKPKSRAWVDIATFRDLLRKEAELRLRVTGGRFADEIKAESDWRLRLYEEWLWTLEKGIGKPIVLSKRYRDRPPQPQPPASRRKPDDDTKRKPRRRQ